MKEIVAMLSEWGGIILLGVIAVIGIVMSVKGSWTADERHLNGQDDEHYVLRQPAKRIVWPLLMLVIGVALEFIINFLQQYIPKEYSWISLVAKLAVAVVFGLIFWAGLAKVIRRHVFVNGDAIVVTPALGASIETTFSQIRTVANKLVRGAAVGKKIKTKEGKRFEIINSMSGYDLFCEQLDEKVELPNLTRKLFRKERKKVEPEPEPEDRWYEEPGLDIPKPGKTEPEPIMPEAEKPEPEMHIPETEIKEPDMNMPEFEKPEPEMSAPETEITKPEMDIPEAEGTLPIPDTPQETGDSAFSGEEE